MKDFKLRGFVFGVATLDVALFLLLAATRLANLSTFLVCAYAHSVVAVWMLVSMRAPLGHWMLVLGLAFLCSANAAWMLHAAGVVDLVGLISDLFGQPVS